MLLLLEGNGGESTMLVLFFLGAGWGNGSGMLNWDLFRLLTSSLSAAGILATLMGNDILWIQKKLMPLFGSYCLVDFLFLAGFEEMLFFFIKGHFPSCSNMGLSDGLQPLQGRGIRVLKFWKFSWFCLRNLKFCYPSEFCLFESWYFGLIQCLIVWV